MGRIAQFLIVFSLGFAISCSKKPTTLGNAGSGGNSPAAAKSSLFINARKGLILREKPTDKSRNLAVLPFRHLLQNPEKTDSCELVDGKQNCWYKISENQKTGFVFGGYLLNERPKFFEDFKRDVLDAPIKEIPDSGQIPGWQIVSIIPGIEFQTPRKMEFRFSSRKYTGKLYHTLDKTVTHETFTYEDTTIEKYCKSHPNGCGTEGGPIRIQLQKILNLSLADYMRLRISNDPFVENTETLKRITKPWQGFFVKWRVMYSEEYDFIFEKGSDTYVFRVTPSDGPDIFKSPIPESDVEKIFYSLKVLP